MRLYQLAIACTVYDSMTGFGESYRFFRTNVGGNLDFDDGNHLTELLKWLRKWGCRQFEKSSWAEEIAKESIRSWAQEWISTLPDQKVALDHMSIREIELAAQAYVSLKKCSASKTKTVGPTGASKILFADRPKALPPWDEAMRAKYKGKGEEEGYRRFLLCSQREVLELKRDAARLGISPARIPESICRPDSTLCELVNAYTWITETAELKVPTPEQLAQWHSWSKGG